MSKTQQKNQQSLKNKWARVDCPVDGFGGYVSLPYPFTLAHFKLYRDIDKRMGKLKEGEADTLVMKVDDVFTAVVINHWAYVQTFCDTRHLEGFDPDWLTHDLPPEDAPLNLVFWLLYVTTKQWQKDALELKNS